MESYVLVTANIEIVDTAVANVGSRTQTFGTSKGTMVRPDTGSLKQSKRLLADISCWQVNQYDALAQFERAHNRFSSIDLIHTYEYMLYWLIGSVIRNETIAGLYLSKEKEDKFYKKFLLYLSDNYNLNSDVVNTTVLLEYA
ncbi:hypothetical protein DFQ29_009742 [Apophysomyces sp. BC1021]|nr:hypothetical protein DFQ29_009742 [Apophysomyces sp. BC1021]